MLLFIIPLVSARIYTDEINNVSFQIPDDWIVDEPLTQEIYDEEIDSYIQDYFLGIHSEDEYTALYNSIQTYKTFDVWYNEDVESFYQDYIKKIPKDYPEYAIEMGDYKIYSMKEIIALDMEFTQKSEEYEDVKNYITIIFDGYHTHHLGYKGDGVIGKDVYDEMVNTYTFNPDEFSYKFPISPEGFAKIIIIILIILGLGYYFKKRRAKKKKLKK